VIASVSTGIYKTPREVMQMTVAEIELLSCYQPETRRKQKTDGMVDPEEAALRSVRQYLELTPRAKLEKRLADR
jgi:hypothetical protein